MSLESVKISSLSVQVTLFSSNSYHSTLSLIAQEYLGSYVTTAEGKLEFQEGVLVQAVREGHWIVLDELNLAPSEVLEALNRLLDDNHELLLPETQEVIQPHPHFRLFATQNPAGLYGGRKQMSRAFRNRFLELHFDNIPDDELAIILEKRCALPPSYCKKLVLVMKDLQTARQHSQVFAGKQGFITLRDLFRWANRHPNGYEELAEAGFMLLGERLRVADEKEYISTVIEKHMKVKLNMERAYDRIFSTLYSQMTAEGLLPSEAKAEKKSELSNIVWTKSMKRMMALTHQCLQHQEPVLLIGETGCGKTSVCQVQAVLRHMQLRILNCHQHTDASDILGGLRPTRGKEKIQSAIASGIVRCQQFLQAHLSDDVKLQNVLDMKAATLEGIMKSVDGTSTMQDKARTCVQILQKVIDKTGCGKSDSSESEGNEMNERPKKRSGVKGSRSVAEGSKAGEREKLEAGALISTTYLEEAREILELLVSSLQEHRKLFEWYDGPLVAAMQSGDMFLIDEVSLAEDSVLERLNSVLEPSRRLVLPEKGGDTVCEITAHAQFRILATMNPGGDFGKRELSPALRNRFTEIWAPAVSGKEDLVHIVCERLTVEGNAGMDTATLKKTIAEALLDFLEWVKSTYLTSKVVSLRDVLTWVLFINGSASSIGDFEALLHGAFLVVLDGVGLSGQQLYGHHSDTQGRSEGNARLVQSSIEYLLERIPQSVRQRVEDSLAVLSENRQITSSPSGGKKRSKFGIHPFFIQRGSLPTPASYSFSMSSPTTSHNLLRLLRGMQLHKAILLEGSPGVGKTSLVSALAAASGHPLVRINLSEQTDIMDLLGSDLPVEGGVGGEFAWRDGILLDAIKKGHWVLLDELNLASQSVLEGLNAILDHRGEVYIPELGITFTCPSTFRVFACQNPTSQGGGRKGLPKSFLNRFTQVYIEKLIPSDYRFICRAQFPHIDEEVLDRMIAFNMRLHQEICVEGRYCSSGGPWEFNLRDLFRWCELMLSCQSERLGWAPHMYVHLLYFQRMRTPEDRAHARMLYQEIFQVPLPPTSLHCTEAAEIGSTLDQQPPQILECVLRPDYMQVGHAFLSRKPKLSTVSWNSTAGDRLTTGTRASSKMILPAQLGPLEHIMKCVEMGWMTILVGGAASGKTSLVQLLSDISGNPLQLFAMNSSVDTMELLGGFEQVDPGRYRKRLHDMLALTMNALTQALLVHYFKIEARHGQATEKNIEKKRNKNKNKNKKKSGSSEKVDASAVTQEVLSSLSHVYDSWHCYLLAVGASFNFANGGSASTSSSPASASSTSSSSSSSSLSTGKDFDVVRNLISTCTSVASRFGFPMLSGQGASSAENKNPQSNERLGDEIHAICSCAPTLSALEASLAAYESVLANPVTGRFEWVDGVLIRAMKEGHWLLIDNVNFCNPTVLDRLNPLMEHNGCLVLNERGPDSEGRLQVIHPHPSFRLFLTMDPANGEISRAMRNRGIEVALLPLESVEAEARRVLYSAGIPPTWASYLTFTHEFMMKLLATRQASASKRGAYRLLHHCGELILQQLQLGELLPTAFIDAVSHVYCRTIRRNSDREELRNIVASMVKGWKGDDEGEGEGEGDMFYIDNSKKETEASDDLVAVKQENESSLSRLDEKWPSLQDVGHLPVLHGSSFLALADIHNSISSTSSAVKVKQLHEWVLHLCSQVLVAHVRTAIVPCGDGKDDGARMLHAYFLQKHDDMATSLPSAALSWSLCPVRAHPFSSDAYYSHSKVQSRYPDHLAFTAEDELFPLQMPNVGVDALSRCRIAAVLEAVSADEVPSTIAELQEIAEYIRNVLDEEKRWHVLFKKAEASCCEEWCVHLKTCADMIDDTLRAARDTLSGSEISTAIEKLRLDTSCERSRAHLQQQRLDIFQNGALAYRLGAQDPACFSYYCSWSPLSQASEVALVLCKAYSQQLLSMVSEGRALEEVHRNGKESHFGTARMDSDEEKRELACSQYSIYLGSLKIRFLGHMYMQEEASGLVEEEEKNVVEDDNDEDEEQTGLVLNNLLRLSYLSFKEELDVAELPSIYAQLVRLAYPFLLAVDRVLRNFLELAVSQQLPAAAVELFSLLLHAREKLAILWKSSSFDVAANRFMWKCVLRLTSALFAPLLLVRKGTDSAFLSCTAEVSWTEETQRSIWCSALLQQDATLRENVRLFLAYIVNLHTELAGLGCFHKLHSAYRKQCGSVAVPRAAEIDVADRVYGELVEKAYPVLTKDMTRYERHVGPSIAHALVHDLSQWKGASKWWRGMTVTSFDGYSSLQTLNSDQSFIDYLRRTEESSGEEGEKQLEERRVKESLLNTLQEAASTMVKHSTLLQLSEFVTVSTILSDLKYVPGVMSISSDQLSLVREASLLQEVVNHVKSSGAVETSEEGRGILLEKLENHIQSYFRHSLSLRPPTDYVPYQRMRWGMSNEYLHAEGSEINQHDGRRALQGALLRDVVEDARYSFNQRLWKNCTSVLLDVLAGDHALAENARYAAEAHANIIRGNAYSSSWHSKEVSDEEGRKSGLIDAGMGPSLLYCPVQSAIAFSLLSRQVVRNSRETRAAFEIPLEHLPRKRVQLRSLAVRLCALGDHMRTQVDWSFVLATVDDFLVALGGPSSAFAKSFSPTTHCGMFNLSEKGAGTANGVEQEGKIESKEGETDERIAAHVHQFMLAQSVLTNIRHRLATKKASYSTQSDERASLPVIDPSPLHSFVDHLPLSSEHKVMLHGVCTSLCDAVGGSSDSQESKKKARKKRREAQRRSVFEERMKLSDAIVRVSLLKVYLLLPASEMDPYSKYDVYLGWIEEEVFILREEISFRTAAHRHGDVSQERELLRLHKLHSELKKLQQKYMLLRTYRASQCYDRVVQRMRELERTILNTSKVMSILDKFRSPHIVGDSNKEELEKKLAEEALWQVQVAHYLDGLQTEFASYRDVFAPFYITVCEIKYGIRLAALNVVDTVVEVPSQIAERVLEYPHPKPRDVEMGVGLRASLATDIAAVSNFVNVSYFSH